MGKCLRKGGGGLKTVKKTNSFEMHRTLLSQWAIQRVPLPLSSHLKLDYQQ